MPDICIKTGKQSHETKEEAMAQRRSLRRSGERRDDLTSFKCQHCGGWHLGHQFQCAPHKGKRR